MKIPTSKSGIDAPDDTISNAGKISDRNGPADCLSAARNLSAASAGRVIRTVGISDWGKVTPLLPL
ncbi:hypothetical protein N8Z37_00925 [Octadecabacter sp.]|nr:hypothetical protein [Octadecabacter sp.]